MAKVSAVVGLVLVVAGGGTVASTVQFAPRYAESLTGYAAMLAVGFILASGRWTRLLLPVLTLAVVVAPRVVQQPYPLTDLTTGNGKWLCFLAFVAVGAGTGVASDNRERALVLVPAALISVGLLLTPQLLLDPSFGWLAATGGLFVLARRWETRTGGMLLVAFAIGVASIYFLFPGLGGDIAVLPSGVRAFGVFGNALVAADSLMFMTASLIAIWWRHGLVVLLIVAAGLGAVVRTGSRTGLLLAGFLLLSVIIGLFPTTEGGKRAGRALVALSLGMAGAYFLLLASDNLGRIGTLTTQEGSWVARAAALRDGLLGAVSHPFGSNTIAVTFSGGIGSTYENLFFDVGARLGWFPLAGVLAAFVLMFRAGNRPSRVALLLLVLGGFTAAIYYHPAAYVIGVVGAGIVDGVGSRRRSVEQALSLEGAVLRASCVNANAVDATLRRAGAIRECKSASDPPHPDSEPMVRERDTRAHPQGADG